MNVLKHGFSPVYDENSHILILGSFPSVKSRKVEFYYGNKQNAFWKTVCGYFGRDIPDTTGEKIAFLLQNNIALWDIVTECEIEGSKDATIKNFRIANLDTVLSKADIKLIILNGGTAFNIFKKVYGNIDIPYLQLPSTSPANTLFDIKLWISALDSVFKNQHDIR